MSQSDIALCVKAQRQPSTISVRPIWVQTGNDSVTMHSIYDRANCPANEMLCCRIILARFVKKKTKKKKKQTNKKTKKKQKKKKQKQI